MTDFAMNDDNVQNLEAILTPESIQNKADILETNIYKDIKKLEHNTLAQMRISRENTINVVVEKAVNQVLFRFNIHPSILENEFKEALMKTDEKTSKPVKVSRGIQGGFMDQGNRQLDIVAAPHLIVIQIQGIKPIIQQDEAIAKIYFEHETHPGKLLPNGKIDFRELHRFPSVKMGDNLLFVTYPIHGKPGVSFEGKVIPVTEPHALDLTFKDGIIKKEHFDEEGKRVGYFLSAARTGVILIKKIDGTIREIDVSDRIELDTIDFSIGNIGSEFVSPVSMKIGTIKDGFKIRAHGTVEVTSLDGGHVFTDQSAVIDQVRPNSSVRAHNDVNVRTVMDAELVSEKGKITIKDEIRDSKLEAPEILFKSSKGIMLNSSVEAHRLDFQNVYYCGVNKIYLGRYLFDKRRGIIEEQEKLEKKNQTSQESVELIKAKLLNGLKKLASQITDQNLLNMFKLLIHSLQTFTFSDSFRVLENMRAKMNVMQIDQLKKTFQELENLAKTIQQCALQKKELSKELEDLEYAINNIHFSLKGKINPTATIQIYCHKRSMADPVFEIKPVKKDTNEPVACTGSYHLDSGFKTQ